MKPVAPVRAMSMGNGFPFGYELRGATIGAPKIDEPWRFRVMMKYMNAGGISLRQLFLAMALLGAGFALVRLLDEPSRPWIGTWNEQCCAALAGACIGSGLGLPIRCGVLLAPPCSFSL